MAYFTVPPSDLARAWLSVDVDRMVNPRVFGEAVFAGAVVAGLALSALIWQRRHRWTARLSLPLLGYAVICGVGLAMLVLISQSPRYLARVGLADLHILAEGLDVRHTMTYFGFAIVVAAAWRRQASLPILAALLMAYGYLLELAQLLVPTRTFLYKDLFSNGLGILVGMCWVYLYDSLFGSSGTALSRLGGRRYRRRRAMRPGARAKIQPRRT